MQLRTAGLFAGIGGIELGLHRAGHTAVILCEIMPEAQRVLRTRREFRSAQIESDIRALADCSPRQLNRRIPETDLVTAGFPCQDLSQAGRTAGISGKNSGLVNALLKLLKNMRRRPKWVLIENVPFMLQLHRGRAMQHLTSAMEEMGFRWAYRVVDTRAFGLPQRRQRVIMLATKDPSSDPRDVLLSDDISPLERVRRSTTPCGFYWTEGTRGLGWAVDAVPTLKGGSSVGIPSPPAVWYPDKHFVGTPEIRDAERLQGFPADWTRPATEGIHKRNGPRWKLVGNAVSVPVSEWVGRRLSTPGAFDKTRAALTIGEAWPKAAYGEPNGKRWSVEISEWPCDRGYRGLKQYLDYDLVPLSPRATSGFLSRFEESSLSKPSGFVESLKIYLQAQYGSTKCLRS
jgi:DNA (cytosine-5)-methyltransferase 1